MSPLFGNQLSVSSPNQQNRNTLFGRRQESRPSGRTLFGSSSSVDDDEYNIEQVQQQIDNAQARLASVGAGNQDQRNIFERATNLPEGQNAFFDVLELIDRAKQTVTNPIHSFVSDRDDRSIGRAAWEGLSGQSKISGKDILTSSGMDKDRTLTKALGFGLDVGLDPTTYIPGAAMARVGRGIASGAKAITPEPIQQAGRQASEAAGEMFNVRHGMDRTLTGQGPRDLENVHRGYHDTQRYMSDKVQDRGIQAVRAAGGYEHGTDVGRFMEGVTTDVTPEVRRAAEILQAGNKVVSDYALQSGVQLNRLENYMTHVPTKQGSELFRSLHRGGSETGTRQTIAQGGDDRILKRSLDMPVEEANQVLRNHYKVDFDIFETNAFRASVIGQQRLINYTAVENAKKQILNNQNLARPIKPGETVRLGDNDAIIQPERYNFFKILSDTGEEFTAATRGQEYLVTKAAKRFLDNANPKMSSEGLQKFLNTYDKVHQMWKQTALFSVGFHLRNGIGNMYNMWVSGVPLNKIVQYQGKAIRDIRAKGRNLDEFKRQGLMEESIYRQDFGVASPEKELMKRVQRADNRVSGRLRDPDTVDPTTGKAKATPGSVMQAPFDMSRELGLNIDLYNRYAHFRYLREDQGLTAAKAAERVREVLFDYSALTSTERQIKRLVPFYTWMRNNIPFQLKNLAIRPRKASQTHKFIQTTYDLAGIDSDLVPEWVQDAFNPAISGDGKGSGQFAGLNLPISDLAALSSPPRMATGALTPLVKLPVEWGTNYDTFRQRPIEQFEGQRGQTFGLPAKLDHTLSQIGALRNLAGHTESITQGDAGSVLKAGIPRQHDAQQAEFFALLNELQKLQDAIRRYEQETGNRPPTINELRSNDSRPPSLF